ncbi:tubulin-like doman-containing protein [Variovorax sp. dw_954]|uniref:tubulin-like doman-containing protein n=1 Tax=Variovorax sp. dw_954 TaxID=2720078 RepID=UPI001BD3D654|nr:tubulin-like doman-containing protein [Variovorax sp. dw_954]
MSNNHLIVGLGGTGGKVIRSMRKIARTHTDATGQSLSEANFEYVYLDTSEGLLHETDKWTVLGQDCSLARAQVGIYAASAVQPILKDPDSYPGMRDWIEPRRVFDFIDAGTAGAAQKRKLGRLVFAQNARQISQLFEDRLQALESSGTKTAQATIHVICGLAGGTGSGFIADTIAQLRRLRPSDANYRILVYALLPDEGSTWAKSVAGFGTYYANGYAALTELNAMAARRYRPVNVLDGSRLEASKFFNGCYLVNNINENRVRFGVQEDVPHIIAEFLYQKTLNKRWEALARIENGENDTNFIEKDDGVAARAKLFMSFGIKRVVVPEQEIKEYLAYGFAEQATRQLMFNNFRQGEGFADEPLYKDWGAEVRKPAVLEGLQISDSHLTLDRGILDDDAKAGWKLIDEYWPQVATMLEEQIKSDKTIKESEWIRALRIRLSDVYDDTFRRLGGVRKFYEVKSQARLEMARHVVRRIEKDFFGRWSTGELSLLQLRQFVDAVLDNLTQRKKQYEEKAQTVVIAMQKLEEDLQRLVQDFNGVGTLGRMFTDKRDTRFAEAREKLQMLFSKNTWREGYMFGQRLIILILDELTVLRGKIDQIQVQLTEATEAIHNEQNNRLRTDREEVCQTRIFDMEAVRDLLRRMTLDERGQVERTQRVRKAIVALAGSEVNSFEKLAARVNMSNLITTLAQQAAEITDAAHTELAQNSPVMHVNIVERLSRQYAANSQALSSFVADLYREAGNMVPFNKAEVERRVPGNEAASAGLQQAICVMLPECEQQREFRQNLSDLFGRQKDAGTSDAAVVEGTLTNEVVVIKVSSLMPARFVDTLAFLKTHYDGLCKIPDEAVLLHGEGDGSRLPPLFAPTGLELQSRRQRKPYLLLARLLNFVKVRENPITGLKEWIIQSKDQDGFMRINALSGGGDWAKVWDAEQTEVLQKEVDSAVKAELAANYAHRERKDALYRQFVAVANERLEQSGHNADDAQYTELRALIPAIKDLIGMREEATA